MAGNQAVNFIPSPEFPSVRKRRIFAGITISFSPVLNTGSVASNHEC